MHTRKPNEVGKVVVSWVVYLAFGYKLKRNVNTVSDALEISF